MPSWLIFAILSAVFAALTAIFAKAGLKDINSDLAMAIRTVIILFIAWGIVFFRGYTSQISSLTKNNWIFLILSAVATGLSWIFYFRALQVGKVAAVSAIDKGSIVLTVLLAFVFLKEPITLKTAIAITLIAAGMLIMAIK
ncbi:EamA family transporter [Pinibacter aurantiacus]|uniref:EamA family transporter n=1 Tax=Pinibacter aurantiacus TaxID=2851599 RepID=A0A9E2SBL9_9BACT|nr:EamA family transporter [Pinibacter aurantiacus]MBV4358494.1 EamA family transporter [Pinibacter aurantiacus]